MTQLFLTFSGHIPSKKNSRKPLMLGSGKNKRIKWVTSDAFAAWEKAELISLREERKRLEQVEDMIFPVSSPYRVTCHFYPGSLMDFDLSNSLESINDVLVDAGFLTDDKWRFLQHLDIRLAGFDSSLEHCKIKIESLPRSDFDRALDILKSETRIKELACIEQTSQAAVKRYWMNILCQSKPSSMSDVSSNLMSTLISNATE